MNKRNYIYTITAISNKTRSHCVGWYSNLDNLLLDIKKYPESIYDNDGKHLVIEKVPEGIEPFDSKDIYWFEYKNDRYVETNKPHWAKNIVCWSMG